MMFASVILYWNRVFGLLIMGEMRVPGGETSRAGLDLLSPEYTTDTSRSVAGPRGFWLT